MEGKKSIIKLLQLKKLCKPKENWVRNEKNRNNQSRNKETKEERVNYRMKKEKGEKRKKRIFLK